MPGFVAGFGAESSGFLWGASDPKRVCVLRVFFCLARQERRPRQGNRSAAPPVLGMITRRASGCCGPVNSPEMGDDPPASPLQTIAIVRAVRPCSKTTPQPAWPQRRWHRQVCPVAVESRSLVEETWYRHLAIADRLIVEARLQLAEQKDRIFDLERRGEAKGRATALLGLIEQTLRLMQSHRATILQKLAGDPQSKPGLATFPDAS